MGHRALVRGVDKTLIPCSLTAISIPLGFGLSRSRSKSRLGLGLHSVTSWTGTPSIDSPRRKLSSSVRFMLPVSGLLLMAEWVEELYPGLFERIKSKVSEGLFQPLGATWVEMDTNMPSGEALIRQFLYGQRFYESRFGFRSETFVLPDTCTFTVAHVN